MPSRPLPGLPRPLLALRRPGLLTVLDLLLGCGYGLLGWVIVDYQTGPAQVVRVAAGLAAVSVAVCRRWVAFGYATALVGHLIPLTFMQTGGGLWLAFLATPPMGYALFRIGARHRVRWAVAALLPGSVFPITVLAMDGSIGPAFPIPLVLAPVVLIGYAERRYHQEVVRYHARLADLEHDRSRLAVVEERMRIARELHDVISHGMSVITVQAGFGRLVGEEKPEQARTALGAIEDTSRQVLGEMRRMLGVLRADDDEPPMAPAPGLTDVDQLIARTGRAEVRVDLTVRGRARDLPPGIDSAGYRIIQEALTNVVRHARTDACRVRIEYTSEAVALEITDDGDGGPPGGHGLGLAGMGLAGMRERAEMYGGRLEAGPLPGRGFRVAAWLPLPALPAPLPLSVLPAPAVTGTSAPRAAESAR